MDARKIYEAEIISLRAFGLQPRRAPGLSDAAHDSELEAARIFFTSLEHFLADLDRAAALSDLRREQLKELRDAMLDYTPGMKSWEEAISAARRGYA